MKSNKTAKTFYPIKKMLKEQLIQIQCQDLKSAFSHLYILAIVPGEKIIAHAYRVPSQRDCVMVPGVSSQQLTEVFLKVSQDGKVPVTFGLVLAEEVAEDRADYHY